MIVLDGEQGWMKQNEVVTPYPALPPLIATFLQVFHPILSRGPRSVDPTPALPGRRDPAVPCSPRAVKAPAEGRPAVGLRMGSSRAAGGLTWYFDKETGLLLKTEQRTKRFEGEDSVKEVTLYGDYQTFDGILRWPARRRPCAMASWRSRPS